MDHTENQKCFSNHYKKTSKNCNTHHNFLKCQAFQAATYTKVHEILEELLYTLPVKSGVGVT